MFSKALPVGAGTRPTAVDPGSVGAGSAGALSCSPGPSSAISDGSISMNIGTSFGSSARPASCFSRPIALS